MAMEKAFREIIERLDRIEAKLGAPQAAPANVSQAAPAPWAGYDDATVNDVVARLDSLNAAQRAQVLAYERANKNRSGIITPLVNWNS